MVLVRQSQTHQSMLMPKCLGNGNAIASASIPNPVCVADRDDPVAATRWRSGRSSIETTFDRGRGLPLPCRTTNERTQNRRPLSDSSASSSRVNNPGPELGLALQEDDRHAVRVLRICRCFKRNGSGTHSVGRPFQSFHGLRMKKDRDILLSTCDCGGDSSIMHQRRHKYACINIMLPSFVRSFCCEEPEDQRGSDVASLLFSCVDPSRNLVERGRRWNLRSQANPRASGAGRWHS